MMLMPLIDIKGGHDFQFLPMMFMMAGLMRILYAVIFQEGSPRKMKQGNSLPYVAPGTMDQLGAETRGSALPPSRSVPVSVFGARRMDTAEMVRPPSITEHTTKLLDESQDPK